MKTHLFRMECLTDLHVGNGEANYSIIDNEVQKDTVLHDVPIIHASGVKGALREFLERIWGKEDAKNADARIKTIFGDKDGAGGYKFFTAMCLARPLRVTDGAAPYVLATSGAVLKHFSGLLKGLGRSDVYDKAIGELTDGATIEVEGKVVTMKNSSAAEPLIAQSFAVFDDLQDYALPVRARNVLDDNGLSKNLWYEELVPHESIFFLAVIVPDDDNNYHAFQEAVQKSAVQFGGNASIGNGYTTIREVYPL